jgi:tetratricopeptide (TPR) repeat protein
MTRVSPAYSGASAGRVVRPLQARETSAVSRYRREDVLRILRLPVRQLAAWERAGLVSASEEYSFDELVRLRKLRDLAATRISVKSIRRSVDAMQKVSGMENPLGESVAVRHGSGLKFRQWGALVDPVTRQMAFDFESTPATGMTVVGAQAATSAWLTSEVQAMFLRAVRLEENADTLAEAKDLYEGILQMQPGHAPAAINLGTIRYNERDYASAEMLYRRATEADPEYALAFFDLGNVLDEQQRLEEAIAAYERALALVPQYADAHYNLALAYERMREPRRALRHWTAYARLDPSGPWANHARSQARKILGSERLTIVCRHGRTLRVAG